LSIYYKGKKSDHFDGERFFDPTHRMNKTLLDFIKWRLKKNPRPWPKKLNNKQFDIPPERVYGNELRVSNVGHVTFLIQTQGLNILTDPVWSQRASPVRFAGPKRVIDPGIKFDNLPPIDLVLISHNHYDHLDIATIEKLWQKFKPRIITPLGNDTIIKSAGNQINVQGYDWGDSVIINGNLKIHLDPAQHWSARGIFDRDKALWAAFTISSSSGNIYFVGDSGYGGGRYFKAAKEKYGSFRLALLPMGAYDPRWFMEYAHMDPEEMLKAHIDLGAPYTIPSHYHVFQLTDEGYGEVLEKFETAKKQLSISEKVKLLDVGEFWLVP
jgi:L-ascorbate metabolism protein UlaG (beta-lactamase superfamily)